MTSINFSSIFSNIYKLFSSYATIWASSNASSSRKLSVKVYTPDSASTWTWFYSCAVKNDSAWDSNCKEWMLLDVNIINAKLRINLCFNDIYIIYYIIR